MHEQWIAVDEYITGLFPSDPALEMVLQTTRAAGMPQINVSPVQGRLLHVLALTCGARTILEIGTLAGYSAIWMARALPADGKLITLESDPKHAEVARANIARAGLADRIEVRLGVALDVLPQLAAEGMGPFDLIFIDADKTNLTTYFEWAVRLARPGSLIIADNVIRHGDVLDDSSADASLQGVRRFNEALAADRRVTATIVQMVGIKGYDGMALAVVRE
ncbi:MAG: O-methyltransferase [Roseiflexus sp.]|nr:O-methyltransferase [Roseiflexus sp.]MBO9336814.1 O-methyltransferase [Roseiflexus sp.]MBO9363679.1 O-methyltransferase [Roseiflexus sp.]MBO9382143.1 O-methyltransferase [Roseiflexus sp.]MBO9388215.1 O-methyltransferase [Roseiflexus sp.]